MDSNYLEAECFVNRGYCLLCIILKLHFCKDVVRDVVGFFKARPFQSLSSTS